jgi:hypothetical protein
MSRFLIHMRLGARRALRVAAALTAALLAAGGAVSASAATPGGTGTLTPFLDCVTSIGTGSNAQVVAYFGYSNTTAYSDSLSVGDLNQVSPGIPDQGQPTVFDVGVYPKVFGFTFDPTITPVVSWILNGQEATASTASPQCTPGLTAPASDVAASGATLNGVVVPDGTDTTYTFEYGTTASYGTSTTVADAGSGLAPVLVQAQLTGLQPSTTYYYRLDTTTTTYASGLSPIQVTTDGQQQTFTTAGPAGMTLVTTSLPVGQIGHHYRATLMATGGTSPYLWFVTRGKLPAGLRLHHATGVISGRPTRAGTRTFAISVIDSGSPIHESLRERFTITIDN